MNAVIIFGTHYGSARDYAEKLAEQLRLECFLYKEFRPSRHYDLLLYVGSLYAGGVPGLAKTLARCAGAPPQRVLVVTVGISDPADAQNAENIANSVCRQLPAELRDKTELFHVRGRLDYPRLKPHHRLMMKLVYQQAQKTPPEKRDEETRALIATYNQTVDFVDFSALEPVIDRYRQLDTSGAFTNPAQGATIGTEGGR